MIQQVLWDKRGKERGGQDSLKQYREEHQAICHRTRWHFYYEDPSRNRKGQGPSKNKPNWSREDIIDRAIYSLLIHTLATSSTSCSPSTSNTRSRRRSDLLTQLPSLPLFHFSRRLAIRVVRCVGIQRPFRAAGVVLAIPSLRFVGNPEMGAKSLMMSFTKLYNAIDKGNRGAENPE